MGVISIADTIREKAVDTMQQLKSTGIAQLVMLTGDNKHTAHLIGEQLGMDSIFAELLPEDKALKVNACMGKGRKLAMIGDGVNDAPALASADVGIAMGVAGTDIAMETADVVLMKSDLSKITDAISLSNRMNKVVKQNVTFSLVIITILVAGNFLQVVDLPLGVIGHEGSTILVILNGLRLLKA